MHLADQTKQHDTWTRHHHDRTTSPDTDHRASTEVFKFSDTITRHNDALAAALTPNPKRLPHMPMLHRT